MFNTVLLKLTYIKLTGKLPQSFYIAIIEFSKCVVRFFFHLVTIAKDKMRIRALYSIKINQFDLFADLVNRIVY